MTERDPLLPTSAEQAVQNLAPPPPAAAAQQAALQAALAAFAQQTQNISQGSDQSDRLTPQDAAIVPPQKRGSFMQRARLLGGMALSFIVVGTVGFLSYDRLTENQYSTRSSPVQFRADVATTQATAPKNSYGGGGANMGLSAGSGTASGMDISSMQMANQTSPSLIDRAKEMFAAKTDADAAAPADKTGGKMQMAASDKVMSNAAPAGVVNEAGQPAEEREVGASHIVAVPEDSKLKAAASPDPLEEFKKQVQAKDERAEPKPMPEKNVKTGGFVAGYAASGGASIASTEQLAESYRRADVARKAANQPAVADRLAEKVASMPSGNAMIAPPPGVAPVAPPASQPTSPLQRMLVEGDSIAQPGYQDFGRDKFEPLKDNPVVQVAETPVSTFSLDVDTAAYAFMRRSLNNGHLPPKDSVRVEELVNYFDYDYALPETRETPFKPSVTVLQTPWNKNTKLIHIGIKGFDIQAEKRPTANLVFLIDTSGSMDEPTKLPLAKNALKLLVDSLQATDHVAIVTYAGNAGTVLEPTAASDKAKILNAIEQLGAGGSTAGAEGIRQAYNLAQAHFDKNGVNRVILATDGDFNVGITDPTELQGFIERERTSGVFLSVLGFGTGNYNDALMQKLAQNGNGTAAYIDNLNEARRVLVDEASRTLFPIAKDVKIQIEFNPLQVSEYRLIGYETRALQREDFNNDKVDAGDVGAGASVTALYEITTRDSDAKLVDDLRYGAAKAIEDKKAEDKKASGEYAFLKIRYKLPDGDKSKLISTPVTVQNLRGTCPPDTKCEAVSPSDDVRFATAVAAFGQMLRGGKYTGTYSYDDIIALANAAKGKDDYGLRSEFVNLVRLAKSVPPLPKQP